MEEIIGEEGRGLGEGEGVGFVEQMRFVLRKSGAVTLRQISAKNN